MGMPLKGTSEINDETPAADGDNPVLTAAAVERGTVGDRLAAARKAKGLSYQDVFNGTKIKIANIASIETGDRAALPAVPFTAGFVKAYAQFLGLNPEEYGAAYRAECGIAPSASLPPAEAGAASPAAPPVAPPRRFAPVIEAPASLRSRGVIGPENYVSYFGIGATVLCALWIGARVVAPKGERATPVARVEAAIATAPSTPAPTIAPPMAGDILGQQIPAAIEDAAPVVTAAPNEQVAPEATAEPSPRLKVEPQEEPRTDPADEERPALETAAQETDRPAFTEANDGEEEAPALDSGASEATAPAEALPSTAADIPPVETESSEAAVAGPPADEVGPAAVDAPPADPVAPATTPAPSPAPAPAVAERATTPGVVEARMTRNVAPQYPERCASRAQPSEAVEVAFAITAEGRPAGVHVTQSSNACFNSAAVDAAYDMRFSPRTENGAPVAEDARRVTLKFVR